MTTLSILIPSRNEMFLNHTLQDVLTHAEMDLEIIVVLDGSWPVDPVPDDPRVVLIHTSTPIGQRAAVNMAARASRGKYLMKLDAHCSVGQGFDRILLEDFQPGWTMVPKMYNLHVFDWVCTNCHWRRYQGPSGPCEKCDGETVREVVWRAKTNPEATAMLFDRNLKFGYWSAYKKRQSGDLVETMSLLGACWLVERDRFFDLELCDEQHGSWGQMGTEIACKTWLSGGSLICSKKTWFAHAFRTQGGDWGFPYPLSGSDVEKARAYSRWLWLEGNWNRAIHPLSWLVDKFGPVPGWETKGILYYTDNQLEPGLAGYCREQIAKAGLPITSASLQPLDFGENIVLECERGPLTMHRQILAGLKAMKEDVVFLCEHDVIYPPEHFHFCPARSDTFYYDTSVWQLHPDGTAIWTDDLQQVSGLCAYRELLIRFYERRIAEIEARGFDRHYEPSTKTGEKRVGNWQSARPRIDVRHSGTLTRSKRSPGEFRNQRYAHGWTEARDIPGWGSTANTLEAIRGI